MLISCTTIFWSISTINTYVLKITTEQVKQCNITKSVIYPSIGTYDSEVKRQNEDTSMSVFWEEKLNGYFFYQGCTGSLLIRSSYAKRIVSFRTFPNEIALVECPENNSYLSFVLILIYKQHEYEIWKYFNFFFFLQSVMCCWIGQSGVP